MKDIAEWEYQQWCREHGYDPEDTESMRRYEEEHSEP